MNQEDKKKLMKCIVFTLLLSPPYTLSLLLAVCSRNPDPGPNIRSRLGFPPPSPLRFVPSSTSRKTSALFALVDSSRISKGRYDRRTFFSKNFPNLEFSEIVSGYGGGVPSRFVELNSEKISRKIEFYL